jgi:formyltetrahydrofolate deformylase
MTRYLFTMQCEDQPGIVRACADIIADLKGNIVENDQYTDSETGVFYMRTTFDCPESEASILDALRGATAQFDPVIEFRPAERKRRVLLMVSKQDHCLLDLLYRWKIGELPVEIPMIVSNHETCRPIAEDYGIPYEHIPVTPETKPEAEARLEALIEELDIDFVVMARYMQILSTALCERLRGRVINIHHSFLPGFKGAKPYHQAAERGVKLIGATAHFATPDLDEGPIIEQDVMRVTHAQTGNDLVSLGRDIERTVLSRAVKLHAEDRVMLAGHKTVVFTR